LPVRVCPEPPRLLTSFALSASKLLHLGEREARVGEAVALPDELEVQELSIREVDISECAAVPVAALLIVLEADVFSLGHPLREGRSLLTESLYRLVRMNGLGRVDADETDLLAAIEDQRIAIYDAGDNAVIWG